MLRVLLSMVLLFSLVSIGDAKIYKWVDDNGTVHFTDKPYSGKAKEVQVKGTGITFHGDRQEAQPNNTNNPSAVNKKKRAPQAPPRKEPNSENIKEITEDDYRITSGVGKSGADSIRISGRISSGPRCKNMLVTATASSDTGLSATISTQTKKVTSHGSAAFSGITKVSGSADDFGFWDVTKVTVRCDD